MKKALVIGSEGQDGKLLCLFLKNKKYDVWGLGRHAKNADSLTPNYIQFDLREYDSSAYEKIINNDYDEVYYLAAFHQSSVGDANIGEEDFFKLSFDINLHAFVKVLSIIHKFSLRTKVFYASSSLIFSGVNERVQSESTIPSPVCLYSISKATAGHIADLYKEKYGLYVAVGILYNHESIYRPPHFLSKKIANDVRDLLENKISEIVIADLNAETDWGYALDYVEAMWHILQLDKPDKFIISSGESHKVSDWFDVISGNLKVNLTEYIKENKSLLIRKKPVLIGNNRKLIEAGWKPRASFEDMVIKIFENKL